MVASSNHPSPHSFFLPLARTNAYHYSFFHSAIKLWNQLPDWIHTDSFPMFKNYLTLLTLSFTYGFIFRLAIVHAAIICLPFMLIA